MVEVESVGQGACVEALDSDPGSLCAMPGIHDLPLISRRGCYETGSRPHARMNNT